MNAVIRRHPSGGRILDDLSVGQRVAPGQRLRGRRRAFTDEQLRDLFEAGKTDDQIAAAFGCSRMTVFTRRRTLRLMRRKGRLAGPKAAPIARESQSRHEPQVLDDKVARMPPVNHPALTEKLTIYPSSVSPAEGLLNLFVSGQNSWKIGSTITKGRWRGFPVYTLTLEERATCPVSCGHWRSCYGNGMNWAKRIAHGPVLEERIGFEVGLLRYRHPGGFAVRLHVLGDFYSVGYVALWRSLIERFPQLHVFGFSARVDLYDDVAIAVADLIADHWPRFAVRLSNAPRQTICSTVSIEHPLQKPDDAIVCPQQTGRTASCSTCALCWSTDRRIAFLRH